MDESTIYKKLYTILKPSFLKVENESHLHESHSESPNNGNSHFSVTIKSDFFRNLNRVDAQRKIYEILKLEMKNGVHALRIKILN